MTIAAGFVCRDAVLLCADTEHTGWMTKTHHSKIGSFGCPGGKVAFALAGNSAFAWSAIQKLKDKLQATPPDETISVIEKLLEKEYRRHVLAHPDHSTDGTLDYQLLIALWSPAFGVDLYITAKTSMRKVDYFECTGIGGELAAYLIRPSFYTDMQDWEVRNLAAYALSAVKGAVQGCGGGSTFIGLRKDGTEGTSTSYRDGPCKQIDEFGAHYDAMIRDLLLNLANLEVDDSDFEKNLKNTFVPAMLDRRQEWRDAWQLRETEFAKFNAHLSLTPAQLKEACLRWSMGYPPIPQPSPE